MHLLLSGPLYLCGRLLADHNAEAREVRLNEGQTIAYIQLDGKSSLQDVIRALDWVDYRGKKLRASRSSKWK